MNKAEEITVKGFYNLDQLSQELNISKQTLRKEIAEGKLKAYKKGGRLIISREDVKAWLEN